MAPKTQVYIGNAPELQDLELVNMLTTWFGIMWPGNPTVISISILKQDPSNDVRVVSDGVNQCQPM